ncbi:MAG: hypothetical protein ACLFO1_02145 [Spirochaetaceae bacterium]
MNTTINSRLTPVVAASVLLLMTACATPYQWTSYPADQTLESLTAAQWQEDIAYLRAELPDRNPHFHEDPDMAQRFDESLAVLEDRVDVNSTPGDVITGMARAIALIGEGHTSINASPDSYFPVIAGWFADGFYVAGADREYEEILGTRILGVRAADGTDVPLPGLEELVNSVIAADHENGLRPAQGNVLINPYLMRGLGLADGAELTYLLEIDGAQEAYTVEERAGADLDIVRAKDDAPQEALVDSSSEPNWYTRTGPDDEVIYISYDSCEMAAAGFFQAVLNEIKRTEVERVVVDLRANSGGVSFPGTWFASQLGGIPRVNRDGGLFVLVGPRTFSSGMMMAVDLMDKTDALFAGEPLAENVDAWGEVKRFPLPNSGLMIGHSTRFIRYGRWKELRLDEDGNIVPDEGFEIRPTFGDYENGRDPVLEAVLAYESS